MTHTKNEPVTAPMAIPSTIDPLRLAQAALALTADSRGKPLEPPRAGIEAVRAWRDAPDDANREAALDVLRRCGTLVLEGAYVWLGEMKIRNFLFPKIVQKFRASDHPHPADRACPIGMMAIPAAPESEEDDEE